MRVARARFGQRKWKDGNDVGLLLGGGALDWAALAELLVVHSITSRSRAGAAGGGRSHAGHPGRTSAGSTEQDRGNAGGQELGRVGSGWWQQNPTSAAGLYEGRTGGTELP